MTREDLYSKMKETGLSHEASKQSVDTFFDLVSSTLENKGKVNIKNFASFETKEKGSIKHRKKTTGELTVLPAKTIIRTKFSKQLRDLVNASSLKGKNP